MLATGTATDPLGALDTDAVTISAGTTGALRTMRSSFFSTRINWGNSITETEQGPLATPDPYNSPVGPMTMAIQLSMVTDARSVGMRLYKHADGHGVITCGMWNASGTLLASKTLAWVPDDGGWLTVMWDAPVDLANGETYSWGYHYPSADQHYAQSTYVWNNGQDTCVYPFLLTGKGSWTRPGGSLTFKVGSSDDNPSSSNFYIDPIVEWDCQYPGYVSGTDYFGQFPNGGSRFDFPIIIDFADPQWLDDYKALGVNTLISGAMSEEYAAAIKAADMDWYPTLHDNDMTAPQAVLADSALALCVRGYMLTDEPEFEANTYSPSVLRTWRNNCRRLDSTRPIYLNMGRMVQENQGFNWHPVGISAKDVNLQWREYMSLVDIGSQDCYGIARTYPFTYNGSDSRRYGIWIYPLVIQRMRTEVTDERMPIWGEVETTSAFPNEPTPEQVKRAVWASLIPGAKGIAYFDHRFAGPAVGQDFAAMIHDAPMAAAITDLNAQIITLADALNADEAGLIEGYTSTGTMARALGGYAIGAKIPMHYSSRVVGGTTYFFCQAIREGSTTVTFSVPGFQGATLTVIGEARTVVVDGSGLFVDDFDDGDYTYHLYSTTATPVFVAPNNTVAPVITTDGTPETGEVVTCSTGTWDGIPGPTFTHQWQRDSGSGFVDVSGATAADYTLVGDDEGTTLRCVVTATNSQGSDIANSGTISPTAAGASPWVAAMTTSAPAVWWRLLDLTEEVGGKTLTDSGVGTILDVGSIVTDPADGAKNFDASETASLYVADHIDLRLKTEWSIAFWFNGTGAVTGSGGLIHNNIHYRISCLSSKLRVRLNTSSGNFWEQDSTQTLISGSDYFVVVAFDYATNKYKCYINGVLDFTYSGTINTAPITGSGSTFSIGDDQDSGAPGWMGDIDEVAIWHRTLDATEVADLYAAGTA